MALTGARLYVANSGSNTVSMIDLETNSVRATIPGGYRPDGSSGKFKRNAGLCDEL